MENNTQTTHKISEEDSSGRRTSARLASASVSTRGDLPGLRRSTRETLSKGTVTPERPTTRKSERLEKQSPSPSSVIGKSAKKRLSESPLRRSERCKKQCPSLSSSESKNCGKDSGISGSHTHKIGVMEEVEEGNSTKKSTRRAKASRVESSDTGSSQMKMEMMDTRAYLALFRKQEKKSKPLGNVHYSSVKVDVIDPSRTIFLTIGNTRTCSNCFEKLSRPRKLHALDCTNSGSHSSMKLDTSENRQVTFPLSEKLSSAEQSENPGNTSNLDSSAYNNVQSFPSPQQSVLDTSIDMRKLQEPSLLEVEVLTGTVVSIPNQSGIPSDGDGCKDMGPKVLHNASAVVNIEDDTPTHSPSSSGKKICAEDGVLNLTRKSGEPEAGLNLRDGESFTKDVQQDQLWEIQADTENNCHICKLGGLLLCCDGKECRRSFHLSCLSPPLEDVPLGIWYCPACVKKKMEFGAHSISKGVEVILDVREVEASDANGLPVQKQFFVKYKGLAHIHNRWVPEAELLVESPSLIARLDKRNSTLKWKPEWAIPHRLLEKRMDIFHHHDEEGTADRAKSHYLWLVKWCGLGYELATWESEDEPFFKSSETEKLIKEYETRRTRAKKFVDEMHKIQERKKDSRIKLSKLPDGIPAGLDNTCLEVVNRLLEFWQKSHNAFIIDDKEHMLKVISFITSLQSDACRPFLIISSSSSLNSWEEEFFRLGRLSSLVVYNGDKELRRSIRNLEFFDEGGATMLQVLLSASKAVAEDMDVLKHIEWEAIIVDDCQRPGIIKIFEEIKMLITEMRLLLYRGPLKESFSEYSDLLYLLDHQSGCRTGNSFGTSSSDTILKMKERLSCFTVYGGKVSRFLEYWVPVRFSNVQLEQYCAILLSNSFSLRSPSKTDLVGALRDIVLASRKCCDHPYIVEPLLQNLLIKDLRVAQYLDVGIKASGKLQLLDKLLFELRKRALRVVIMFQSFGSSGRGSISIGDILDDLLQQRFGAESYERVDGDVTRQKKVDAMNNFNNKDLGRFVFLLESRACNPSIKLVSVDVVIIYGSDWNPVNDIRNLQKAQLESQLEPIKLFRLYTSGTVEEKVLINAKSGTMQSMQHPNSSHCLLMWGAEHLFENLEQFHRKYRPSSTTIASDQSHIENVLRELLSILPVNDEGRGRTESSSIFLVSRAMQGLQTYYSKEIPLLGESKFQSPAEELPSLFWKKLLDGKAPEWKYSSVSHQRNRKRIQMNENRSSEQAGSDEVGKKRRKVAGINVDVSSKEKGKDGRNLAAPSKEAVSGPMQLSSQGKDAPAAYEGKADGSDEQRTHRDAQSRLHLILKPQISRLCAALSLEGEVKNMVYAFLDYVINNRVVNQEPATIVQAFQLALCWTAASLAKFRIDHKESHALAKERLNYDCSKDEADGVYTILRGLKKPFLRHIKNTEAIHASKAPEEVNEIPDILNSNLSQQLAVFPNIVKVEIEDSPVNLESSDKDVLSSPTLAENDIVSIQEIHEYSGETAELLKEQEEERNKIYSSFEAEKGVLEHEQKLEACFLRQIYRGPMRAEKLKALEIDFARKMKKCEDQMNMLLQEFEDAQVAARNKILQKTASSDGVAHQVQSDSLVSMSEGKRVEDNQENNGGEAQQALQIEAAAINEVAPAANSSVGTDYEHDQIFPDGATPEVPGFESSQGQMAEGPTTVQNGEVPSGIPENIKDVPGHDTAIIPQSEDVASVSPLYEDVDRNVRPSIIPRGDSAAEVPAAGDVTSTMVIPLSICDNIEDVPACGPSVSPQPEDVTFVIPDTEVVPPAEITQSKDVASVSPLCEDVDHNLRASIRPRGDSAEDDPASGNVTSTTVIPLSFSEDIEDVPGLSPSVSPQPEDVTFAIPNTEVVPPAVIPQSEDVASVSPLYEDVDHNVRASVRPGGDSAGHVPAAGDVTSTTVILLSISENMEAVPGCAPSVSPQPEDVTFVISNSEDVVPREEAAMRPNGDVILDIPADEGATSITAVPDGEVQFGVSETSGEDQPENVIVISEPEDGVSNEEASTRPNRDVTSDIPANGDITFTATARCGEVPLGIPETSDEVLGHATSVIPHAEDAIPVIPQPVEDNIQDNIEVQLSGGQSPDGEQTPGVVTVPENGDNEAESASEHCLDEISPMVVDSAVVNIQAVSGQLSASSSPGDDMPLNQSSMPRSLQEDASHRTNDMPPESEAAEQSHQPDPGASDTEATLQVPAPSNPPTVDGLPHQHSQEDGLDTRNALNQPGLQTVLPSSTQMAAPPPGPLESGSLASQSSLLRSSQVALPRCSDPLLNELERLELEADLTGKIYEDTKSKLQTDCEKEIAQIRRKYETKLQENEAEYLTKRNELQSIQTKVHMHRILAEAFRAKCMDLRASAAQAVQQDTAATFIAQLLSPLPRLDPQASPLLVPGPSSASSALLQNNIRGATSHPMGAAAASSVRPPPRPPAIISWNIQVQPEVRAATPRLQHFRPSLPRGAPPPPPPGYLPTFVTNLPAPRAASAQYSGAQQPDNTGGGRIPTPSVRESTAEMLRDLARRTNISSSNHSPIIFQMPPTNLTVPGSSPAIRAPTAENRKASQPICLSDDDD